MVAWYYIEGGARKVDLRPHNKPLIFISSLTVPMICQKLIVAAPRATERFRNPGTPVGVGRTVLDQDIRFREAQYSNLKNHWCIQRIAFWGAAEIEVSSAGAPAGGCSPQGIQAAID